MRHWRSRSSRRLRLAAVSYDQLVDGAVRVINRFVETGKLDPSSRKFDQEVFFVIRDYLDRKLRSGKSIFQFFESNPEIYKEIRSADRNKWLKLPVRLTLEKADRSHYHLIGSLAGLVVDDLEFDLPERKRPPIFDVLENIPPQESISEENFWEYIAQLKGNAKRVLKVVPAGYWKDFSEKYSELWAKLRHVFERLGMIELSDSSLDFAAGGVIRRGQDLYYDVFARAEEAGDADDFAAQKTLHGELKKYSRAADESFAYPINMLDEVVDGTIDEYDLEDLYGIK